MLFNKRVPRFLYETPEVTPAAPPPVVVPESAPASPWAADAAKYFGENAESTAAFDRYMREVNQPYVTKLEEGSKDAVELWTDLNADPDTAVRDLVASVYRDHPEIVSAYDGLFTPPEPVVETPPVTPEEVPEWAKPLVERDQATRDAEIAATQAANYQAFKDGLKETHQLTDDDIGLIDPFIYASPSDPDAAVSAYRAWLAKAGVAPTPTPPVPAPPPVLGDGNATPPLATQYTSYDQLGDALKAHLASQRVSSTPPPVVG